MKKFSLFFFSSLFCLTSCSEQQIYNAGQGAREQECMKLPNATDMRHCLDIADKEYGQYIRDRY